MESSYQVPSVDTINRIKKILKFRNNLQNQNRTFTNVVKSLNTIHAEEAFMEQLKKVCAFI